MRADGGAVEEVRRKLRDAKIDAPRPKRTRRRQPPSSRAGTKVATARVTDSSGTPAARNPQEGRELLRQEQRVDGVVQGGRGPRPRRSTRASRISATRRSSTSASASRQSPGHRAAASYASRSRATPGRRAASRWIRPGADADRQAARPGGDRVPGSRLWNPFDHRGGHSGAAARARRRSRSPRWRTAATWRGARTSRSCTSSMPRPWMISCARPPT